MPLTDLIVPTALVIVSTVLGALGSYFFKLASGKIKKITFSNLLKILFSKHALSGFFLFFSSSLCYVVALSQAQLTYLYPLTALSYVWAIVIGHYVLREKVDLWRWVSVLMIFSGVVILIFETVRP